MSQVRHPTASKVEAVRRVVEEGHRVRLVAREHGVSASSLYFWVHRYRELARSSATLLQLEPASSTTAGTLVAHLRRTRRNAKPPKAPKAPTIQPGGDR